VASLKGSSSVSEWLTRRGGPCLFPVAESTTYREYAGAISGSTYGEGLLDKSSYHFPTVKSVVLPPDLSAVTGAELLVVGTGVHQSPILINGHEAPLYSMSQLGTGREEYVCADSHTVHRSYHLAPVSLEWLRPGLNEVRFTPAHAYVQIMAVRLFEPPADTTLSFEVQQDGQRYHLSLSGDEPGTILSVDFLARYAGMDLEMSGVSPSWQGILARQLDRKSRYVIENSCGQAGSVPYKIVWEDALIPEQSIAFRARVQIRDGLVIESPDGIMEHAHTPAIAVAIVRPESFGPFGYHATMNRDVETHCFLTTPERMTADRAVLRVPFRGSVTLLLNNRYTININAPSGGVELRDVEIPVGWLQPGSNRLDLRANGEMGCYQAPGPHLYLVGA
jgi:hypothetical protein